MRLQEEYMNRHNLSFMPIYHTKDSKLILNVGNRPQIMLDIQWRMEPRSAGYYELTYMKPNYNGYLIDNYFVNLDDNIEHIFNYNEYPGFIFRWAKNLGNKAYEKADVEIAIWEMFLYCFDGWFLENNLEELVFPTIELLPNTQRLHNINNFLYYLSEYRILTYEIYMNKFKPISEKYADWLANLINYHNRG